MIPGRVVCLGIAISALVVYNPLFVGRLYSAVEGFLHTEEVTGSIPVPPTTIFKKPPAGGFLLFQRQILLCLDFKRTN